MRALRKLTSVICGTQPSRVSFPENTESAAFPKASAVHSSITNCPREANLSDVVRDGSDSRAATRGFERTKDRSDIRVNAIPEPPGLPLVGTLFSLIASGGAKKLHEHVDARHRQLGPIYRERIGPVTAVFLNSPHEYRRIFRLEGSTPRHFLPEAWVLYNEIRRCRRGLLFMDGAEWLHFRRILNKIMLVPDPSNMSLSCHQAAQDLTNRWRIYAGSGTVVELERQLYQWSIEVMLATLMGSSWHSYKQRIDKEIDRLARTLHKIFECSSRLSMLPAKLAMTLNLPAWSEFVTCVDEGLGIVRALVPEVARLGGDGLLKTMMDEGIRDDDLVRIVADFIIAAGDTTAFSTQWALYLLGSHPALQNKLFESIRGLSTKELLREPLLKGVIKETLRMYPIAPFITRYLPEDSIVGDFLLQKETLLLLSIYSSSRDARNFPEPHQFRPERWIRKNGSYEAVVHPHASLPFAMGARSCIGRKLAETQLSLALAELVKAFEIHCINSSEIKMILHLISVPSVPVQLKLISRRS